MLVIPRVVMVITSVNGGASPLVAQASVDVVGSGFGSSGQLLYNGAAVAVTSWTPTLIRCGWPDVPFESAFSGVALDSDYLVTVVRSDGARQTRNVRTLKRTADINRQITSIASNGIFANDSGITAGMRFNWRTLSGIVSDVDSTGRPRGTTVGATGKYAVWTGAEWTNTANSIVTI